MCHKKKCTNKRWKDGEPFAKRMGLLKQIEKEVDRKIPENITNEASEYNCYYCGCDHCGQPILLRECTKCGSTFCGCHILPEEHDCMSMPTEKSWNTYREWQEKLR